MAIDTFKLTERSVDSLQATYAVIVALALSEAIRRILVDRSSDGLATPEFVIVRLPAFLAFLVTLVPFYQGMNRHLDYCYVEKPEDNQVRGALLFDFFVFFIESAFLFAASTALSPTLTPFLWLVILLGTDTAWGILSHWIHYRGLTRSTLRWSIINFLTVIIGIPIALTQVWPPESRAWLLLVLAIARTAADYWTNWEFYFPPQTPAGVSS